MAARRFALTAAAAVVALAVHSMGRAAGAPAGMAAELQPPSRPTTVWVQLTLIQAGKIDAVEQAFYADMYCTLFWVDNRVNTSAQALDGSSVFWPRIEFVNRLQSEVLNAEWTIQEGWYGVPAALIPPEVTENDTVLSAYTRISSTFVTVLNMHDFPADKQNATVIVESPVFNASEVSFLPLPGSEAFLVPPGFDVVGWTVLRYNRFARDHYYAAFDQAYSRVTLFVELARLSTYYTERLVANVGLLTFMGFLASTLRPDVPERTLSGPLPRDRACDDPPTSLRSPYPHPAPPRPTLQCSRCSWRL